MATPEYPKLVTSSDAPGTVEPSLKSGDGGGTSDDMGTRVKLLEYRADQVEKRFDRLEGKIDLILRDVSEMKGRMNAMPTTWQMVGFVVALTLALFGYLRFGLGFGG